MQKIISNKKKGFTLIELIVVMAVIAILVLLAIPRLLNYTKDAKLTQIVHDVKVVENVLEVYLIKNNDTLPPNGTGIDIDDIKKEVPKNKVFNNKGLITDEAHIIGSGFEVLDNDFVKKETKSKLSGDFIASIDGRVYYIHDKAIGGPDVEQPPLTEDEIDDLISQGYIPVANANELQQINGSGKDEDTGDIIYESLTWGEGTKWERQTIGTLDSKYIQVQDIDLSSYDNWIPIGVNPGAPFAGEYNGGNYLIDNLNIEENTGFYSAGLFGSVSNGNVIISNIKMRNVNVDINDSDHNSMLIGDMGLTLTGETTLSIINIDIEGNVSGSGISSGLVGFIGKGTIGTIKDITIKGNILSTDSSAGGIIGEAYTNIDTIENILIEGNVSGIKHSGGLIGFIYKVSNTIGTIKDITIKGDISNTDSSAGFTAGGIIGEAHINIDTIENILIEGNVSGGGSSGGLIGDIFQDTIGTIIDITIRGDISSTAYTAGGIIGQSSINIDTIENILIEGDMIGKSNTGGLIGFVSKDPIGTIKDITIKGNILNTDTDNSHYVSVGGLIGQTYTNIDTIENILIEGIIKGESAGGLTGEGRPQLLSIYDVKIINSEINGIKNSGGLFGALYSSALIDKVLIKDTVIKSDSSHSGGLVGEIEKLTASDITIENSNITGALSTGGIAGVMLNNYSLSGINIDKNTTINGFGSGNENGTGGIGGQVNSTTSISDINISANITGVDNVGEIYGWVNSEGVIEAYSFDGILSGTGINIGGPYGYMYIPE